MLDGVTTSQAGANEQTGQAQSAGTGQADDLKLTQSNQTAATQPNAAGPQSGSVQKVEELPDWAQAMIVDLRKENAGHRKAKGDAEKAVQEAEEKRLAEEKRWQELAEKRQSELEKANQELARIQHETLARDVAKEAGLPEAFAARLRGTTREELAADAAELKKLFPQQSPGAPASPQRAGGAAEMDDTRKAELKQRFRINAS